MRFRHLPQLRHRGQGERVEKQRKVKEEVRSSSIYWMPTFQQGSIHLQCLKNASLPRKNQTQSLKVEKEEEEEANYE